MQEKYIKDTYLLERKHKNLLIRIRESDLKYYTELARRIGETRTSLIMKALHFFDEQVIKNEIKK